MNQFRNIYMITRRYCSNKSDLPLRLLKLDYKISKAEKEIDIIKYRLNMIDQKHKYNILPKIEEILNKLRYQKP